MTEILKETRSICSACGEIVPATYEVRDDEQVFFSRTCPMQGVVDTDLGYHAPFYYKSFIIEKHMIERYGDGGSTDISKGLSPFPLRKRGKVILLPQYVTTSARRHEKMGLLRSVLFMWYLRTLYRLGVSPAQLRRMYIEVR